MEVFVSYGEFSDIEIFQHSGKAISLFMTGHKNCQQADYLLGPGPRLIKKKNLPGRCLTKFEKHCPRDAADRTLCACCLPLRLDVLLRLSAARRLTNERARAVIGHATIVINLRAKQYRKNRDATGVGL
jgi:hypothetical protein